MEQVMNIISIIETCLTFTYKINITLKSKQKKMKRGEIYLTFFGYKRIGKTYMTYAS